MLPTSLKTEPSNPDECACGCRTPVADTGVKPRFASTACHTRWVAQWAIRPASVEEHVTALDDRPQNPPPASVPVPVADVAATRAEFAERVTVAPQVEALLGDAPAGMLVRSPQRSVWKSLRGLARKVW